MNYKWKQPLSIDCSLKGHKGGIARGLGYKKKKIKEHYTSRLQVNIFSTHIVFCDYSIRIHWFFPKYFDIIFL